VAAVRPIDGRSRRPGQKSSSPKPAIGGCSAESARSIRPDLARTSADTPVTCSASHSYSARPRYLITWPSARAPRFSVWPFRLCLTKGRRGGRSRRMAECMTQVPEARRVLSQPTGNNPTGGEEQWPKKAMAKTPWIRAAAGWTVSVRGRAAAAGPHLTPPASCVGNPAEGHRHAHIVAIQGSDDDAVWRRAGRRQWPERETEAALGLTKRFGTAAKKVVAVAPHQPQILAASAASLEATWIPIRTAAWSR